MTSSYETFFEHQSYAVVGHSAKRPFPRLTYAGLKQRGKKVVAVDPSTKDVDGDPAYPDLAALPSPVEAVVLELPREETRDWVAKVADAGIRHLWLHQNTDTPEALELARDRGIEVRSGTCAVQYVNNGFPHFIHKLIRKALRRY